MFMARKLWPFHLHAFVVGACVYFAIDGYYVVLPKKISKEGHFHM
jgi:hypothetical protein